MKRPRGRPKKPASARKSELVRVLLTPRQRKTLEAAAEREGLNLSTWIRVVALKAAKLQAHTQPRG